MIGAVYPDHTFEEYHYERLDLVHIWDRAGHLTRLEYDNVGHPVRIFDRLGQLTQFSWCGCGSLESIVDPLQHTTHFIYDAEGRLKQKQYPDEKLEQYEYYPSSGQLMKVTDAKDQVKTYHYFADDTLQGVVYTGGIATPSVSFDYHTRFRRLTTMPDGTGLTSFTYKAVGTLGAGQLDTVDGPLPNDTITYSYDELGRRAGQSINNATDTYFYDGLGRISRHATPLGEFTPTYVNATARLQKLTYPNSQSTTCEYQNAMDPNKDPWLAQIWNKISGDSTLSKFDYQYDILARVTKWTQQFGAGDAQDYLMDYDSEGQLLGALIGPSGGPTRSLAYGYDAAGNRTAEQIDSLSPQNTPISTVTVSQYSDNRLNQVQDRVGSGQATLPVRFYGSIDQPGVVQVNGREARMTQDPANYGRPTRRLK